MAQKLVSNVIFLMFLFVIIDPSTLAQAALIGTCTLAYFFDRYSAENQWGKRAKNAPNVLKLSLQDIWHNRKMSAANGVKDE